MGAAALDRQRGQSPAGCRGRSTPGRARSRGWTRTRTRRPAGCTHCRSSHTATARPPPGTRMCPRRRSTPRSPRRPCPAPYIPISPMHCSSNAPLHRLCRMFADPFGAFEGCRHSLTSPTAVRKMRQCHSMQLFHPSSNQPFHPSWSKGKPPTGDVMGAVWTWAALWRRGRVRE